MKTHITISVLLGAACCCFAQVKSSYEYNTAMPYGTLDIRTRISSTDYYYLLENKTFSFRESAPGVRTNTYVDMTTWDSSPYRQGNLRRRTGTKDAFVMNYRLLFPNGYSGTYAEGYPMIVMLHGAIERANCYYSNCYHATPAYTVQANSPPAPTSATHRLLNNDDNLDDGGYEHLAARNLAGTRLPNDPSMPARAFPGFVLVAQMFNIWDSLQVQDVVRIVRLLAAKYRIDQNRIYVQGLSIGGYGVYAAVKRAPWLFAAALPMSSVSDASIFRQNQQGRVIHVPFWIFQGGKDTRPTPAYTNTIVNNLKKAGAVVRYSLYTDLAHVVWWRAYAQSDYFSWMLSKSKADLHAYAGRTVIDKSKGQYVKLMLAEGFLAYQWERNGVIISTAKSNVYTATSPGTYRARFSRVSSYPTSTQWNKWSRAVTVTEVISSTTSTARTSTASDVELMAEQDSVASGMSFSVYPNPTSGYELRVLWTGGAESPVEVRLVDPLGREVYAGVFTAGALATAQALALPASLNAGLYTLVVTQGMRQARRKVMLKD